MMMADEAAGESANHGHESDQSPRLQAVQQLVHDTLLHIIVVHRGDQEIEKPTSWVIRTQDRNIGGANPDMEHTESR